jgi:hypothetical protein
MIRKWYLCNSRRSQEGTASNNAQNMFIKILWHFTRCRINSRGLMGLNFEWKSYTCQIQARNSWGIFPLLFLAWIWHVYDFHSKLRPINPLQNMFSRRSLTRHSCTKSTIYILAIAAFGLHSVAYRTFFLDKKWFIFLKNIFYTCYLF